MYPKELIEVINKFDGNFDKDYLGVERTEKAFEPPPPTSWKDTELITNKMSALAFEIANLDITAGVSIFTLSAGKSIAKFSKHSHIDCEWTKLIYDNSGIIGEIKVDGLSYIEIKRVNTISDIQEYYQRLVLSEKITSILNEEAWRLEHPKREIRLFLSEMKRIDREQGCILEKGGWLYKETAERTVMFTFGKVTLVRRCYIKKGVCRYPVYEYLGLEPYSRISKYLLYKLATTVVDLS